MFYFKNKDLTMQNENTQKKVKRIILGAGASVLILVMGLTAYNVGKDKPAGVSKGGNLVIDTRSSAEGTEKSSLAEALEDRQVYFAGIEDCVISGNTDIYLENVSENEDILMKYDIVDKDTGNVLESTDLIPSGEHVAWNAGSVLSEGEHTLIFRQSPYFPWDEAESGYVPLTQANNEVIVTIK